MLKITKISALVLIFYILFYLQVWGDNHIVLYGSALISVLSLVIHCFYSGYLHFSNVPFGIWNNLVLFGYVLVVGYFVAADYNVVISSSVTLVAYSIVCIAICYVSSEEKTFDWFFEGIIVLAILCSFYTFFYGTIRPGYGKVLSENNNPHSLGAVMNLGIFSLAYMTSQKKRRIYNASWLLILFFFYTIIECGSRKYLIVSSLIIAIWLWASLHSKWITGDLQQRIILLLIVIIIVFLGVYMYQRFFIQSYGFTRLIAQNDEGNHNRITFYIKAYEIFIEHPLFGGGYDQFQFLSGYGSYAHSTYAEALADFGIIGCILYFAPLLHIVYSIIREGLRNRNYNNSLFFALCMAELFLGIGQIFFMEFSHFLTWTILFSSKKITDMQKTEISMLSNNHNSIISYKYKYIRA